jgi:hypothetical protein
VLQIQAVGAAELLVQNLAINLAVPAVAALFLLDIKMMSE